MKEQIEILEEQARAYLMMAKLMKEAGHVDSMKMYTKQGKKCCDMVVKLKSQWENDSTNIYQMVA